MKSVNRMVEHKWCVCFDVYWLYSAVSFFLFFFLGGGGGAKEPNARKETVKTTED